MNELFKPFYKGLYEEQLRKMFPKIPGYSSLLKQTKNMPKNYTSCLSKGSALGIYQGTCLLVVSWGNAPGKQKKRE